MTSPPARSRRADARRSRAAILDAATRVLNVEPDASLEAIARAAGVTRPTIYAHFPSREQLLLAVVERITHEAVVAMDAADPGTGPAADVLMRMLDAGAQVTGRYPVLVQLISAHTVSPEADHERHTPVADRIRRVIQRGRQSGEFDDRLPVDWLVAATIRLGHAASEETHAGRLSAPAAQDALRISLLRILGATEETDPSPRLR
ncbi:helix-turn-helix transcriptional regulator [Streptomyces sp. TRM S81-3]|uniref:Helix-turn-helix transcriptional regulator n=1 Tax=Streptomyces griseicoloratus TaxID=2752516 RepID=A0A926KYQ0_9ACTN|nr:TetR/AcrR family transcriptional regulator [Streptomyces griseicoloratus]MBD0419310.1 helix-turn-helix transcriptional regulator [Streptomyces griseicoloratus]